MNKQKYEINVTQLYDDVYFVIDKHDEFMSFFDLLVSYFAAKQQQGIFDIHHRNTDILISEIIKFIKNNK